MTDYAQSRTQMVNTQLRTNDVTDHRILDAMEMVPREKFVPASKRVVAYIDEDLPIGPAGSGRFLLKPHVFGKLIQLPNITADEVVLVVGAGTGYAAAVLSKLAASVVAVEEDQGLAQSAGEVLVELGIDNAAVVEGKLREGFASEGPYDVIVINGAVDVVPEAIVKQLKDGGRLVVIEGRGGAAQARVYFNSGGTVSSRFGFNACAAVLPGFEKASEFVF
ncbi:protein-L-isoaspartate O-methyltransferase [Roseibium sp. RKSG952]|uniref:protein-L-isoaspartate O-methyltransferase family protein n=1 Tax=Roseibium sp. RKSG952 TaxID=2529384 RepID=UPI0012BD56B7|nr:protein-L-isoaspartate O-methyltransferase [Roseibium sp. RKSG952]MTH97996.1 protein-L-isoaspartate O-methyltransferase [Roseibium sp. RKSG952]